MSATRWSALEVEILLSHYYAGGTPEVNWSPHRWGSTSAEEARKTLAANGLIDGGHCTEKGCVFAQGILNTPLPVRVAKWAMPDHALRSEYSHVSIITKASARPET